MKRNYIKYVFPILLGVTTLLTSCEELDEGAKGSIVNETFYTNELGMESGVFGIYAEMHTAVWGVDILAGYTGADDLTTHSGGNKWVFLEGDQFALTDGNARLNGIWSSYYRVINCCNAYINNANPDLDEEIINSYKADAYFARALMYSRLVTLFGDIPLVLNTELDLEMQKTGRRKVLAQAISDFEFAEKWAQNDRDTDPNALNGRVTQTAAKAFLAKTFLELTGYPYNEEEHWTRIKSLTSEIMEADVYSLMDDFAANFEYDRQNNKEIIWAHQFHRNAWPESVECRWYGDFWRGWMDMFLEWNFYNAYPEGWRKNYCTTTEGDLSVKYYHPLNTKLLYGSEKGKDEYVHTWQTHNDMPAIRYAEVLLMYAEACLKTGNESEGYDALNYVRRRAYANNATTKEEVALLPPKFWETANADIDYTPAEGEFLNAILTERKYEFTSEIGGVRWIDLVRYELVGEANANRDDRELPLIGDPNDKSIWNARVPGDEVRLNPNLADGAPVL